MFKWFDRSPIIARLLERTSGSLARQRGLPIVIGLVLIAVSFIVQLISFAFASQLLDVLWSVTHHLGLLIAFVGVLMVEPLGR